jgi:hypothetical protein
VVFLSFYIPIYQVGEFLKERVNGEETFAEGRFKRFKVQEFKGFTTSSEVHCPIGIFLTDTNIYIRGL